MKRSVTLIIGGAVIVVLVGILVLVKNLPKKQTASHQTPTITLAQVPKDQMQQITLNNHGQTVTLKQSNKKWVVDTKDNFQWDHSSIQAVVNSFTSFSAQREVEKNPKNLKEFGLDPPKATAVATLTNGKKIQLDIGTQTPTGSGFYVRKAGEKPLYVAAGYSVSPLLSTLNALRNTQLPSINTQKLTYMKITHGGTTIAIQPIPKNAPLANVSFSNFEMVQPYKQPHAVDGSKLGKILKSFPSYLTIQSFVNDHPTNLAQYGLAPAKATLLMKDNKNTLDIELGNTLKNGNMYAKLPGKPSVFTVSASNFDPLLKLKPFDVVDKFLLIPNIDHVNSFTIKTPKTTYTAEIKRTKPAGGKSQKNAKTKTDYLLDGKTVKEAHFKSFYQNVIGLLADSPNPKPNIPFKPEMSVTFHLNIGSQRTYTEYFVPYNRDFYAVFINGSSTMLLDRNQVKKMITSAQDVLAGKNPPT